MLLSPRSTSVGYLDASEIGPVARWLCKTLLVVSLAIGIGAVSGLPFLELNRPEVHVVLFIATLFVTSLIPSPILLKAPISLSVVIFFVWMLFSYGWSLSPSATRFDLLQTIPGFLTSYVLASVLSYSDIKSSMLWLARVVVGSTLLAVAIFPETRIHIDDGFVDGTYPGWHGFFSHKNSLSPVLVLSLISVLVFETQRLVKWLMIGSISALLVLSTSITGISGALVALCVYIWLKMVAGSDTRSRSFLVASTLAMASFFIAAIFASLGLVVSASGKDMSFSGRTDIWSTTVQFISERPLQGYGLGGLFSPVGGVHSQETIQFWRAVGFDAYHPHNGLLDVTLQLGIVGAAVFILILLGTVGAAWSEIKHNSEWAVWILAISVAMIYMSISEAMYLSGWLSFILIMKVVLMRLKADRDRSAYKRVAGSQ